MNMNTSPLSACSVFKHQHGLENYLSDINHFPLTAALIRFHLMPSAVLDRRYYNIQHDIKVLNLC